MSILSYASSKLAVQALRNTKYFDLVTPNRNYHLFSNDPYVCQIWYDPMKRDASTDDDGGGRADNIVKLQATLRETGTINEPGVICAYLCTRKTLATYLSAHLPR